MSKLCYKCGVSPALSYNAQCRECYNGYMAEYMLARYHRRRNEMIEALGGCCILCGATTGLEFDHTDRSSKAYDIGKILASASEARYRAELEKCRLLCSACHQAKTSTEQSVEHGGGATGKKNCYCALCAPLKRAYQKQWHAARRHQLAVEDV